MNTPYDAQDWEELREGIIGLGEHSMRRSHYPELRKRLAELERFRTVFEHTQDLVFLIDMQSSALSDANPSAANLLHYQRDELLSLSASNVMPWPLPTDAVQHSQDASGFTLMSHLQTRLGHTIPVEMTANFVTLGDNEYAVVVARDVRARIATEAAQRESELLYRMLVDNIDLGIALVSDDFKIVKANHTWKEMATDRDDANLAPCYAQMYGRQTPCPACPGLAALRSGVPVDTEVVRETASGRITLHERALPLVNDSGLARRFIVVAEDVTRVREAENERRRLDLQLQKLQKLESMGVLASGIAHDFNNLLVAVLGNASLAKLSAASPSDTIRLLDNIEMAARRASDLTQRLLAYAGRGRVDVESVALPGLVQEMMALVRVSIPKSITFHFVAEPNVSVVDIDATQIRQVVMNLLMNASEAIGDAPGRITVTVGTRIPDRDLISGAYLFDGLIQDAYVFVEVTDTGCGMDEATQERIFDPFFTTKFTGRGLGLAAVLGIVRQHRGAVTLSSAPGKGTTMTIVLPKGRAPVASAHANEQMPIGDATGTVLVIDDEELVRRVTCAILEHAGFSVITAQDASVGLEVLRSRSDEVAAVVLDVGLNSSQAVEAINEIRNVCPLMPVVLSSGHAYEDAVSRVPASSYAAFIGKPFLPHVLVATVQRALAWPYENPIAACGRA